jgi:hypothetical protein
MEKCKNCDDGGWVCENHPDKPWRDGEGCCGGAGMPCPVCNDAKPPQFPRMPEGSQVIWTAKDGYAN